MNKQTKLLSEGLIEGEAEKPITEVTVVGSGHSTSLKHTDGLHLQWKKTGLTPTEISVNLTDFQTRLPVNLELLDFDESSVQLLNGESDEEINQLLNDFAKSLEDLFGDINGPGTIKNHPWYGVTAEIESQDINVVQLMQKWQGSLRLLQAERLALVANLECSFNALPDSISDLHRVTQEIELLPELDGNEQLQALQALTDRSLDKVLKYFRLSEKLQTIVEKLNKDFSADVVKDLSAIELYQQGCAQLMQLSGESMDVNSLRKTLHGLQNLQQYLLPIKPILLRLPFKPNGKVDVISEQRLKEAVIFIRAVAALPKQYWKYDLKHLDYAELDQALVNLKSDIAKLTNIRTRIDQVFDVDKLPNRWELERLVHVVQNTSALGTFSTKWRNAKKELIKLTANRSVKYATLWESIDTALEYVDRRQKLNEKVEYIKLLGNLYKGEKTDLSGIELLGKWHRTIVEIYGIGDQERAEIVDHILCLSHQQAIEIHKLFQDGFSADLEQKIFTLTTLQKIFLEKVEIHDSEAALMGESGSLSMLVVQLDSIFSQCRPIMSSGNISVGLLAKRVKLMENFRKGLEKWMRVNYDRRLFKNKLGLKIGVNQDNSASLTSGRSSVKAAQSLQKLSKESLVKNCIFKYAEHNTFEQLRIKGAELKFSLVNEERTFQEVSSSLNIDRLAWGHDAQDRLSALIDRNSFALRHLDSLQHWQNFLNINKKMQEMGLSRFATVFSSGQLKTDQLTEAYDAVLCHRMILEIERESPELATNLPLQKFNVAKHDSPN